VQAIEAIYDGAVFKPIQPIPVEGSYKVVITFLEPASQELIETVKKGMLPRSSIKGLLKGLVEIADDFDEPLDEMKEYML